MARVKLKDVVIWINCYLCGEKFQIKQVDYYRNTLCNNCPKLHNAGK